MKLISKHFCIKRYGYLFIFIFLIKPESKIKNDDIYLLNKNIIFNNRVDGHKDYFGLTNLFFLTYWNMNNYHKHSVIYLKMD